MLAGMMLGANGQGPHPTIVLLHGFPGNEKNLDLAQSLRRAGYNVLFFHYRGACKPVFVVDSKVISVMWIPVTPL